MTQKHFALLTIVLVIVAVVVLGFSKFNTNQNSATPSPDVSPSQLLSQQNQTPIPEQSQMSPGVSVDSTQKQVKQYSKIPGLLSPQELKNKKAVIVTNKGEIDFEIYPEATKAASNFIFLVNDKFYDGLKFHRVVPGFVIQGGDPLGNGTGGPGYKFEDESVTKKYLKGIVAMANAGPNTNGSQFFIMLEDNPDLPPKYTIFGKVIKGQEVVNKIAVGDIMSSVSIVPLK